MKRIKIKTSRPYEVVIGENILPCCGKEIARGDKASVTCELSELVAQDKTLTVKVVDSAGKVQKDGDGKELSAKIEIKVKTGFFDNLIAFFRKLFGANKVTIEP